MRSRTCGGLAVRSAELGTPVLFIGVLLGLYAAPAHATLTVDAAPVSIRASSQWDTVGGFGPSKLFDGTISPADLGTTNNLGGQYASSGTGNGVFAENDFNPVVSMDFANPISADVVVYAQRNGLGGAAADKVDFIYVWFTQSAFTPTLGPGNPANNPTPPGAPQEIVTITDRSDSRLIDYPFADRKSYSGTHVTMEFIGDPSMNPGTNPGGYELRLALDAAVPEPGSACLVGAAMLLTLRRAGGVAGRAPDIRA